MRRIILLISLFILSAVSSGQKNREGMVSADVVSECDRLYYEIGLKGIVNHEAFSQAYNGYQAVGDKKKEILTVVDFSKPSTEERFYVIDIKREKLLYVSHVSHGQNSGENYATSFSNVSGSHKSSLGFYLTENTYQGRNGYSLILDGLENGVNDRAKERAIVIHGAPYSNPEVAKGGRLGRSHGCPALPLAVSKSIIDVIKGGSLIYIYAADGNYIAQSRILTPSRPTAYL